MLALTEMVDNNFTGCYVAELNGMAIHKRLVQDPPDFCILYKGFIRDLQVFESNPVKISTHPLGYSSVLFGVLEST